MTFKLLSAPPDSASVLGELLYEYFVSLSVFTPFLLDQTVPFKYPNLESYWTDPLKEAILFCSVTNPVGFAFVTRRSHFGGKTGINDVTEFSIRPEHRRTGRGIGYAHALFGRIRGPWEVRVRHCNTPGMGFWAKAVGLLDIPEARADVLQEDRCSWTVHKFDSAER